MKKIAIYTLQEYNFGNRLQNYAVQEILAKEGFKTVSLPLMSYEEKKQHRVQRYPFLKYFGLFMPLIEKTETLYRSYIKKDKIGNFKRFNRNINYALDGEYIGRNTMRFSPQKYYAILAGSDQIWNTNFPSCTINSFLPVDHDRKIAFSASFGVDNIPFEKNISECLMNFKAISVREDAGKQIIKKLANRDADVLIDPTLMIGADEWRKIAHHPPKVGEHYILTYFLSPKCDKAKDMVESIRKERTIYEIMDSSNPVTNTAGPAEFLWLFDHADLILTDSFHACVFSFLFNKPFVVYDRNWNDCNMNSRLETLLKKFHLERKYANSGLENDIWEHNYEDGYKQLELERQKATDFLKKALDC